MKKLILIPLLFASLEATNIDIIIDYAIKKNHSISAIKYILKKKELKVKRSRNLDNPFIKFGINDIRLDDITNRSLEPMQTNYIVFKQKIPYFGKLKLKEEIAKKDLKLNFFRLKDAQARLAFEIKKEAIRYAKLQELLKLNRDYQKVIGRLNSILLDYSKLDTKYHTLYMQSNLFLSQLKSKEITLKSLQKEALNTISYLSNRNIKKLNFKLKDIKPISFKRVKSKIYKNYKIRVLNTKYSLLGSKVEEAKLSKKIDPTVEVGYFHRKAYKSYISIGVGFKLPIYGTEDIKIEESKVDRLSMLERLKDYKKKLENKLFILVQDLKANKEIIALIKKDTSFTIKDLLNVDRAKIVTGGDILSYFDTLKRYFVLKELLIEKRSENMIIKAQIDNILGVIKWDY